MVHTSIHAVLQQFRFTVSGGIMDIDIYRIWRTLIQVGVITQQQAVNNLPAEMIDAYQARDRIENP